MTCRHSWSARGHSDDRWRECYYCGTQQDTCDCGHPDGSFACKIRHIQINTGAAKAAND
jgi:hypothetical protein